MILISLLSNDINAIYTATVYVDTLCHLEQFWSETNYQGMLI